MAKKVKAFETKVQSSVDLVFEKQKQATQKAKMRRFKRRLFLLTSSLCILALIGLYFFSDISKVRKITISGNHYLSSEYIQKLSGINEESRYLLVFEPFSKTSLKKDPLIQDAQIKHLGNGIIQIIVTEEKAIGYRYTKQPEIILANNTIVKMEDQYAEVLAYLPLIVGFEKEEELTKLIRAFELVEMNTIGMISEIHPFQESYDSNKIRFIMRDGKRVFSGFFTLEILNSYPDYGSISINRCIYIDEMSKVPYSSLCPGQEKPEETPPEEEESEV